MIKSFLSASKKYTDLGLLILRIVVGLSMMVHHGLGKIKGGPEVWERVGGSMSNLGIDFLHVYWGFMAGFSEFFCSFLIVLGILFRPATLLLIITMTVAVIRHLNLPESAQGAGLEGASHALELLAVYVALFLTGPGKYRISKY